MLQSNWNRPIVHNTQLVWLSALAYSIDCDGVQVTKGIPRSILGQLISLPIVWVGGDNKMRLWGEKTVEEADGGRAALIPVPNGSLSRQRGYLQRHLSMSLSGATTAYECGF